MRIDVAGDGKDDGSVPTAPLTKNTTRRHRWGVAVVFFVLAAVMPVATAQPSEISAGEGDWVGFVSFTGSSINGVPYSFRGSFGFSSVGGELDGVFGWSGGDVAMEGVVSGPASMPRFELTGGVSRGVTLTDVSGGGEIQFTTSTCERLEGIGVNWDQVFAGAATITDVVWWAVRDGAATTDPGAFFEAVESLRIEISDIVRSLEAGVAVASVADRVEPLIADAERLASSLNRSDGCGLAFYRSVIAAEVLQLVDFVLSDPTVGVLTFAQVMLMAVRTGVVGSGSETGGDSVETRARDAMAARIASAIATENAAQLDILARLASDMGWEDLEREAIIGIVEVGY
ncbi:MAG: hypothetical protein DWP92_08240 [Armatimonadetes bacterium]|nr:MAG: hypothetical protein DWP92_08240 [Armatimonadota bacterium]